MVPIAQYQRNILVRWGGNGGRDSPENICYSILVGCMHGRPPIDGESTVPNKSVITSIIIISNDVVIFEG